jgi:hypothetical protein
MSGYVNLHLCYSYIIHALNGFLIWKGRDQLCLISTLIPQGVPKSKRGLGGTINKTVMSKSSSSGLAFMTTFLLFFTRSNLRPPGEA